MKSKSIGIAASAALSLVLASCANFGPPAGSSGPAPACCAAKPENCGKTLAVAPATSRCGLACGNDRKPGRCRCCDGGPCQRKTVAVAKSTPAPPKPAAPPPPPKVRVEAQDTKPATEPYVIERKGIIFGTKIEMPPEEAARLGIGSRDDVGVITVREEGVRPVQSGSAPPRTQP